VYSTKFIFVHIYNSRVLSNAQTNNRYSMGKASSNHKSTFYIPVT